MHQLHGRSGDEQLELLVQAAYEISPELSNRIFSSYYSRFPEKSFGSLEWKRDAMRLAKSPREIDSVVSELGTPSKQRKVIRTSAREMYRNTIAMDAAIPGPEVLLDWGRHIFDLDEETNFYVSLWVTECLHRQTGGGRPSPVTEHFLSSAERVSAFAGWMSQARRGGIPEEIVGYFPGLSSKIEVFKTGEEEKAKSWVTKWIKEHAKEYLKLVDPYFGPDEIEFLIDVPRDIKVLIVTTKERFADTEDDDIQAIFLNAWKLRGRGNPPLINLMIVPKDSKNLFHDRAITTRDAGLDIGQSLNGLGKKSGKSPSFLLRTPKSWNRSTSTKC